MAERDSDPWVDQEFEDTVRHRAYLLWERDGRPQGAEKHYWFLAIEKCIKDRREQERLERGLIDPM